MYISMSSRFMCPLDPRKVFFSLSFRLISKDTQSVSLMDRSVNISSGTRRPRSPNRVPSEEFNHFFTNSIQL